MRRTPHVILNIALFSLLFGLLLTPVVLLLNQQLAGAPDGELSPAVRLVMEAAAVMAALLAALIAGRVFKGPHLADFGLLRTTAVPHAFMGVVIGATLIAIVLLILQGGGVLTREGQPAFPATGLFALTLLGLFFNTMFQNIAFRGYVMSAVRARFSATAAVLVSALVFVGAHAGVLLESGLNGTLAGLNLFLAGVLLAFAYLRTGSLWLPIGIHFGWNAGWAALGLSVSGHDLLGGSALFELTGPPLLTGGPVGPEGSLPGLAGPLAGLAVVHFLFRRRRNAVQS